MAIQQLTQPILNPIVAFDATQQHIISFIVIGGTQVVANRLTVQDNQTGNVIYSQIQSSLKLEHILPANTLQNGGYYNAVIETIDNANNISSPSTPVPFYCYSSPTLTITNIPATETIGNGTYKFEGNYSQTEGELLNSYQFTLYNSNKEVLTQTPLIYYSVNNSLSYTFVGMNNDTSYYIELSGQTVNNTKVTTGLLYFTVRYIQPASFAICDLVNNCDDGYIQVSSNIVAIDGHSNPDPPIYIDDKEVDLTDPDAWVNWNSGFRIQDDFTMGAWGRDFNDYQNIITLTNDINTEKTPNRIELKWMIGDVLKEQLYYENINGKFINIENSKVGDIKNLEIYGNSTQFTTSAEYNTASGNPVQFEDGKEGTSLRIQELDGKSTQATRDGKNKFNLDYIRDSSSLIKTDTGVNLVNTWVGDIFTNENVLKTFKPNTTYTMKAKAKVISRPTTIVAHDLSVFRLYRPNSSELRGVWVSVLNMPDKETISLNTKKEYITTFRTPADMTDVRFLSYTFFGNNDGSTTGTAQGEIDVSEIMLVEGTYTAENFPDFELYGISPSPDYPSEIKSIGDDINLFDKNNAIITKLNCDNGKPFYNTQTTKSIIFDCSKYEQLAISKKIGNYFAIIASTEYPIAGVKEVIGTRLALDDSKSKDFFSINCTDYNYLTIVFWRNTDIITESQMLDTVKIQKGTVATSYSEYGKGTLNIEQRGKNRLINSSFRENWTNWGTSNNGTIPIEITEKLNQKCLHITGELQKTKMVVQSIKDKVEKGKTYTLSCMAYLKDYVSGTTNPYISFYTDGKTTDGSWTSEIQTLKGHLDFNNSNYDYSKGFVKVTATLKVLDDTDLTKSFGLYIYARDFTGDLYVYDVQLEEGTEATDYEEYFNNTYTLPLSAPLRSLPNGTKDTIEEDGIHRRVGSVVLDGTEDWQLRNTNSTTGVSTYSLTGVLSYYKNSLNVKALSNYFNYLGTVSTVVDMYQKEVGVALYYNTTVAMSTIIYINSNISNLNEFKTWLSTHNTEVNYELAEEVVEPFTDEQKEIINSMVTEKGTNIINSQTYMILNYNYISANIPSPNNKLPVFSVGDIKNLINISNLNISYNQQYYLDVNTQFLLKPNYTYTLSFDFNINEASTDLYYSLGYGTDRYSTDMTKTTIYSNQTKGRNEITFTVSADIPDNSYLWVRFARTIILADINVDISNIQLEKGKSATSYQSPNEYNIYPIITENNFYDYNNPLYVKGQNVIYTEIDNGYNIKPKIVNTDTYLAIGIKNILTNGNLYGISYSILGELDNVRLYRTNKNSQNIIDEIKIDKGIFIAPNSSYDLQLVFNINSSSLLNYVQIWNIQLEANDVISSYQLYNKNYSQIILEEPLRGIEKYQDWIGITSPNLLNPETGSAKVEEETDYFYNKLVTYTTNVTVQYKNISGNIISSEILAQDSLISTPKNCVEIHIEGLDKETIKSNHLQIRKGTSNEPYLPYITEPSVIKYIKKVVLDGSTQIGVGTNDYGYTWIVLSKKIASDALKGRIRAPMCNIAKGTNNSGYRNYKENLICQWNDTSASFCMALSTDIVGDSALKVQEFFQKQYDNGTSVEIYYMLAEPEVFPLSSTNIEELKSLVTYEPISNIFTNNDVLATLSLDYANSMILQDTQNAYVLLKCWNGNKMPYVIHSNYIDIPETTDNVFIWMRRKKNIFDLKIENLTKGS